MRKILSAMSPTMTQQDIFFSERRSPLEKGLLKKSPIQKGPFKKVLSKKYLPQECAPLTILHSTCNMREKFPCRSMSYLHACQNRSRQEKPVLLSGCPFNMSNISPRQSAWIMWGKSLCRKNTSNFHSQTLLALRDAFFCNKCVSIHVGHDACITKKEFHEHKPGFRTPDSITTSHAPINTALSPLHTFTKAQKGHNPPLSLQ